MLGENMDNSNESMETAENQSPKSSGGMPKIVKWLIGLIILAGIGYGAYYLGSHKTQSPDTSKTTTVKPPIAATKDPTSGWETYSNKDYSISFKYPNSYAPITEKFKTIEEFKPFQYVPEQNIVFAGFDTGTTSKNTFYRSVGLMKETDFDKLKSADTGWNKKDELSILQSIYNNQKVSSDQKVVYLEPINAVVNPSSTPKYISSDDRSFRGEYYYAAIGQEANSGVFFVAQMISEDGVIFNLTFQLDKYVSKVDYDNNKKAVETILNNPDPESKKLNAWFDSYKNYLNNIESNDTGIKSIAENLKLTLKSVSTVGIDPTADWKTYENKEYGFSFKYPKGSEVTDISKPEVTKLLLKVNGIELSINKNFEGGVEGYGQINNIFPDKIINGAKRWVRGYDSNSVTDSMYTYTTIENQLKDTWSVIVFIEKDKLLSHNIDTFDQILSTFKFIQ